MNYSEVIGAAGVNTPRETAVYRLLTLRSWEGAVGWPAAVRRTVVLVTVSSLISSTKIVLAWVGPRA